MTNGCTAVCTPVTVGTPARCCCVLSSCVLSRALRAIPRAPSRRTWHPTPFSGPTTAAVPGCSLNLQAPADGETAAVRTSELLLRSWVAMRARRMHARSIPMSCVTSPLRILASSRIGCSRAARTGGRAARIAHAAAVETIHLEHGGTAARTRGPHDDRLHERVGLVTRIEAMVSVCGHTHHQRRDGGELEPHVADDPSPQEHVHLTVSRLDEVVGHTVVCDEICCEGRHGDGAVPRVSHTFDDLREVEACRAPVVSEAVRADVSVAVAEQTVGNSRPGDHDWWGVRPSSPIIIENSAIMAAWGAPDGAALTRTLASIAAGGADAIAQGKINSRNVFRPAWCLLVSFSGSINRCVIMRVGSENACLSPTSWLGLKVISHRSRLYSTPRTSGAISLMRRVKFLPRRIPFLPWRRATWVGGLSPRSPNIQMSAISTPSGLASSAILTIERESARVSLSRSPSKNRATVWLWGAREVARGLRPRGAAGLSVGSLVGRGRSGLSSSPSTFWVASSAAVAPLAPGVAFNRAPFSFALPWNPSLSRGPGISVLPSPLPFFWPWSNASCRCYPW